MPVQVEHSVKRSTTLQGLDQLRAFAITYVFVYHYHQSFGHPKWMENGANFGWTGVDLFFVLSGFLISRELFIRIAAGRKIGLKSFIIKRFFRIIPPYLFVLLVYLAVPLSREGTNLSPLWKFFTFTLNFGLDWRQTDTFSHAWSLCVEEQFYLILPLCILLFLRLRAGKQAAILIPVLLILALFLRTWEWTTYIKPLMHSPELGPVWQTMIYYPTYNRLDPLLIGVTIAGLFTFYPDTQAFVNRYASIFLMSGIIVLLTARYICKVGVSELVSVGGFPIIAVGYGLIVAAAVCPAYLFFNLRSRLISALASFSYSIYLLHKMIIHLVQLEFSALGIDKNSNLMLVISILGVIGAAFLMRILIEKPAMQLRNKILNQNQNVKADLILN